MKRIRYYIVKEVRDEYLPYKGRSCFAANVKPGLIYDDRKSAELDAKRLRGVNEIGFIVVEFEC